MMQTREIQMIPIEREENLPHRQQKSYKAESLRKKSKAKRRRRGMKLRRCFLVLVVCGLCFAMQGFLKVPFVCQAVNGVRVERLKEQESYPKELLDLAEKNPETYAFVKEYPNRKSYQQQPIDISKDCKKEKVPLLMQWDKRWGYDFYGDSMIALSGCGPTCMTMAYAALTQDTGMNPKKMAEYAQAQGYHTKEGTSWEFWIKGAADLGLHGEEISLDEAVMQTVLDAGGLIVCSMRAGDFTDTGHYILIRAYDENGFFVNDPNCKSNSEKQWEYSVLQGQIKNLWALQCVDEYAMLQTAR